MPKYARPSPIDLFRPDRVSVLILFVGDRWFHGAVFEVLPVPTPIALLWLLSIRGEKEKKKKGGDAVESEG